MWLSFLIGLREVLGAFPNPAVDYETLKVLAVHVDSVVEAASPLHCLEGGKQQLERTGAQWVAIYNLFALFWCHVPGMNKNWQVTCGVASWKVSCECVSGGDMRPFPSHLYAEHMCHSLSQARRMCSVGLQAPRVLHCRSCTKHLLVLPRVA